MAGHEASASDRARRLMARGARDMPARLVRLLAGRPLRVDGQTLDPEMQLVLRSLRLTGSRDWPDMGVEGTRAQARRDAAAAAVDRNPGVEARDVPVDGASGALRGRLYTPQHLRVPGGMLVYLHGGGHVFGDLDTHDAPCRLLAVNAGVPVLAVEYRLAPEHPFPAALDDALSAFRWAASWSEGPGAAASRIAIGGDSAGGNLATAASRLAAADGGPVPAFQLLIYPVTDMLARTRSRELFADGFYLTGRGIEWARGLYLPDRELREDPRASPLRAEDLSRMPPAHIVTAGFDPLRDEAEAYGEKLREAGVEVTISRHEGLIHGFANLTGVSRSARSAMLEVAEALRAGLAGAPSIGAR